MFKLLATFILSCALCTTSAQKANPAYNKPLADSLGSDENGMKKYVLAILKTGPTDVKDKEERSKLFKGHMENIGRLAKEGKLVVAGPFMKEGDWRGLFILNVSTKEEAKALVETDPAVKAGVFTVELYQWYGSAALPMYMDWHDKLRKNVE